MKKYAALLTVALVAALYVFAQNPAPPKQGFEYATLRWGGRENTHVILPNGETFFLSGEFRKLSRPEHADERSFYMTAAINGLAKQGYTIEHFSQDEILFRRNAQ